MGLFGILIESQQQQYGLGSIAGQGTIENDKNIFLDVPKNKEPSEENRARKVSHDGIDYNPGTNKVMGYAHKDSCQEGRRSCRSRKTPPKSKYFMNY